PRALLRSSELCRALPAAPARPRPAPRAGSRSGSRPASRPWHPALASRCGRQRAGEHHALLFLFQVPCGQGCGRGTQERPEYLNIKLTDISVTDPEKYPHMLSVKNCFIRGSVVRYVQLPADEVDTQLLQDAARKEALQQKQ
uniref:LSM2 homolog, U6 small nuclear RNA and mRNA degradation associated n=1 Tax=Equus asinus TaxID=9793 RepID=A0A9L0IKH8_EQUAS